MAGYVIRRLIYSIVVLAAASFLVFTFVSVSGDPTSGLYITPNVSGEYISEIREQEHLDDSIPQRYWYWVQTPSSTSSVRRCSTTARSCPSSGA